MTKGKTIISRNQMLLVIHENLKLANTEFKFLFKNDCLFTPGDIVRSCHHSFDDFEVVLYRSTLIRFAEVLKLLGDQPLTILFENQSELFGIKILEAYI